MTRRTLLNAASSTLCSAARSRRSSILPSLLATLRRSILANLERRWRTVVWAGPSTSSADVRLRMGRLALKWMRETARPIQSPTTPPSMIPLVVPRRAGTGLGCDLPKMANFAPDRTANEFTSELANADEISFAAVNVEALPTTMSVLLSGTDRSSV